MAAKSPDAIPAGKVVVKRQWIVDCTVCQAGVETEAGAFESAEEAAQAKQRHLTEHARGEHPEEELWP
jgi:hypothetical protein